MSISILHQVQRQSPLAASVNVCDTHTAASQQLRINVGRLNPMQWWVPSQLNAYAMINWNNLACRISASVLILDGSNDPQENNLVSTRSLLGRICCYCSTFWPPGSTKLQIVYTQVMCTIPCHYNHETEYYSAWVTGVVLATVPDRHFGDASGSKLNRCHIGGQGCHWTRTMNSGTDAWKSPNPSELAGLSVARPVGPSIDWYKHLVVVVW